MEMFGVMLAAVVIIVSILCVFWQYLTPPSPKRSRYRFDSFAPVQKDAKVKWFVDGEDYLSAVADAIESAKKEILITDYQMNPYVFMKRPDHGVDSLKLRLDKMLIRKAEQGVRVYILLYWEIRAVLDLGSSHTQSVLKHRNIKVYRHPHYLSITEMLRTMLRWSHHEKVVVVDRNVAFIGGIDLCLGRWDTHRHKLMDNYPLHPCVKHEDCENDTHEHDDNHSEITYNKYARWVGKDYMNAFFLNKNESKTDWGRCYDDYGHIDRSQIPRMPWHDVACAFTGTAVSDVVKHFMQRYNALYPSWYKYWWLSSLPTKLDITENIQLPDASSYINANVQVLRSVDHWSAGQPHEASIHNAYLRGIENAKHYIYIENQFFISSQPNEVENLIQSALVDRIYRAYREGKVFHVMIVMPLKPEFGPENWSSGMLNSLPTVSYWNYETLYRGQSSLFHRLREKMIPEWEISDYFGVYGLRTHGSLGRSLATEIVYVHTKLMIVDDRVTIIGSANINDRSMLGGRDSEIAIIVEDVDMMQGRMNEKRFKVGKFSHNLRCRLHEEHLGLLTAVGAAELDVQDPLLHSFIAGTRDQAVDNMSIYERVFGGRILPTNQVRNYKELKNWKEKQGLVCFNPELAVEQLQNIRGNIVLFPADFLRNELKPSIIPRYCRPVESGYRSAQGSGNDCIPFLLVLLLVFLLVYVVLEINVSRSFYDNDIFFHLWLAPLQLYLVSEAHKFRGFDDIPFYLWFAPLQVYLVTEICKFRGFDDDILFYCWLALLVYFEWLRK